MKTHFSIIIAFLTVSFNSLSAPTVEPECQLVPSGVYLPLSKDRVENPYDNGYPEERYHYVLDAVIETFNPEFQAKGEVLKIQRDWSDGAVNAWAFRWGQESWLEVPGGMSRYHLINEEGFLMTICHELGHLLGGYPHNNRTSFEGQSDYYAPMKCMEKILERLGYQDGATSELSNCKGKFCRHRLSGIKSLTSYYAFLEKSPFPQISTPSQRIAGRTMRAHPPAQCRFDTMVRALGCADRESFSYDDSKLGACEGAAARPACWFKN